MFLCPSANKRHKVVKQMSLHQRKKKKNDLEFGPLA